MKTSINVLSNDLMVSRQEALRKFANRVDCVGKCFEMPVYALKDLKMSEELNDVFQSSNRAIWLLENSTPEIPLNEKVWDDFEVINVLSFDAEIIVSSSAKLKAVIHLNLNEALKWFMNQSAPNRAVIYHFGNDMNTFVWEEGFHDLFLAVEND
jgi:hypothetical protein